jgi:asparagine synthase (glutamine-hydrolysing)
MCGIFTIFNPDPKISYYNSFNNGQDRGPEKSDYLYVNEQLIIGFHRLAINGLDDISGQPMTKHNCILVCNGEIYNHSKLYHIINAIPDTKSDCEIILDLYHKYGIEQTLEMLDGVFAFMIYDNTNNCAYIARDTYGVRPMFIGTNERDVVDNCIGIASELNMINDHFTTIKQFVPGSYLELNYNQRWFADVPIKMFFKGYSLNTDTKNISEYCEIVRKTFINAVNKRVENTEREIAVLISGGLDSSTVAACVCAYVREKYPDITIKSFSIGMEGSEDLLYAKMVADYLDTKHTNITLTEDDFFDAIPNVVKTIASYDTTTVRASVGNHLVAKYIRDHSECKVVFNGDGADEVCGGYLYFHKAPDSIEFDKECKRLLKDICFYDVLRSDRTISNNGLEARTPFLDKNFVSTYMSIPCDVRNHNIGGHQEKYLLRMAFKGYLPDAVLNRRKEAFSDGVSKETRSWHKIIEEKLGTLDIDTTKVYSHNQPKTKEQFYYRELFENTYNGHDNIIPYFWMPSWSEGVTDASARELDNY